MKRKQQKKKFSFLKKVFILFCLSLPFLVVIAYELKTNELQASFFSWYSRDIRWEVMEGKSPEIVFPSGGPYDNTMGYSRLPEFQKALEANGYVVSAQARQAAKTRSLLANGIAVPYEKKAFPGLRLNDKSGAQVYYVNLNTEQFPSFQSIPPILVNLLLHRENRELLDVKRPFLNPAVEWDRFVLACSQYMREEFFGASGEKTGGSTLATQIMKFRHSRKGRTNNPLDKLKQMMGASIWGYQKNPNTIKVRQEIVKEYLNGMPLGAAPGLGEINGIGNGMWAWYGKTTKQLIADLALPETSPAKIRQKAQTLKEVFSLIIATRHPAFYLQTDPTRLNKTVNDYFLILERDGVISSALTQAVFVTPLTFRPGAPLLPPVSLLERKGLDALRAQLLSQLGIKTLYELERMDLTVDTSLDFETQQKVNAILDSLYDQKFLQKQGFIAPRLLGSGDPGKVVYSVALFESQPEGTFLRIQTDTLDKPLSITTGIKLELGSTAKLRTLATYLMVIDELDEQVTTKGFLSHTKLRDSLSRWVADFRRVHPRATRQEVLRASLAREFPADPHHAFFTGGGLHRFKNFDGMEDDETYTIEEGFCQSVNLVFIRLMRELVNYYTAALGYDKQTLLAKTDNPKRSAFLREAANYEAVQALRRYYTIHKSKTYAEALAILSQSPEHPIRNWLLLYLKENPDAGFAEVEAQAKNYFGEKVIDSTYLNALFKQYRGKSLSVMDEAYLLGKHPLEVWFVTYLKEHPQPVWEEVLAASKNIRERSSAWLLKTPSRSAQNLRIRSLLERKAFEEIHRNWKTLGYPFDSLVPSLATAIGSSADRPADLAELIGIILNEGRYVPTASIQGFHFAEGTPYETHFTKATTPERRVMSPEVAQILKETLLQVVENGTGRRIKNTFFYPDGTSVALGGKTGTGDNRLKTFQENAQLINSTCLSRTSTFVFFADRYFGIVTAHVEGPEAGEYEFTSALAVQVLKTLRPALELLFHQRVPNEGEVAVVH